MSTLIITALVGGVITGLGLLWIVWRYLKQRDEYKAKADTEGSYIGGEVIEHQAEADAKKAMDDAQNADNPNPLDL